MVTFPMHSILALSLPHSSQQADPAPLQTVLVKMGRYGAKLGLAALLAGSAILPGHAQAQGAVRTVHEEWEIRCDTPPGAPSEQCALMQHVTAADRDNVGLAIMVLKTADQSVRILRVLAPLGVLLPQGLGLRVDDTDVGRASFVRCLPQGCVAEVIMDEKLIDLMSNGDFATFIVFQTPEEGIGIPIPLNGFKSGFAQLK